LRQGAQILVSMTSLYLGRRLYRLHVQGQLYDASVDVSKQVFIITGSNTGLGYETAKEIARMGGTVVMACRSVDKAEAAKQLILADTKCAPSKVMVLKLDLNDFGSVSAFVKEFIALQLPLHCLINNAGLMTQNRELTPSGLEQVFTANHLSHFKLTNLLLPELNKTNGRIVVLTSSLHKAVSSFDFEDVMSEKSYSMFPTYSQSKLANVLFVKELAKRLKAEGSKVTVNAVHPGCVRTDFTRHMSIFLRVGDAIFTPIMKTLQKTPSEGAYCSLHVATSPLVQGITGEYFFHSKPCAAGKPGTQAVNDADAERLWKLSEAIIKKTEGGKEGK